MLPVTAVLLAALLAPYRVATAALGGIENTVHNLRVDAPRARRAPLAGGAGIGMCEFCHTPHTARPMRELWARRAPALTYKLYQSSTLKADLKQPTGASRLCLSCHDGTLAMGALRGGPAGVRVSLGRLSGGASLGTDLSDDHPISFVYDSDLATRRGDLADPSALPTEIRLDQERQLQCTTCHDPHESAREKFLVVDNRGAQLCTACHRVEAWSQSAHATSSAPRRGGGRDPWPHSPYQTVADNGCTNCHAQHGAEHPEWLLTQETQSEACLVCHDGSVAATDIRRALLAPSAHPIGRTETSHQPNEDPLFMPRHVACPDCHEPHSARASAGTTPRSTERLGRVSGVEASGQRTQPAQWEYEVCYKCHGLRDDSPFLAGRSFTLLRSDNTTNIRAEFAVSNVSYHPVEARGRNDRIEGLEARYTAASMLRCTDCHSSERGRSSARGPHGSAYEPILTAEYRSRDPSTESPQAYALCYSCHDRSVLLADSDGFPHRLHVVDKQASCVVCHDAHGSRNSPFLVNFLVRGKAGEAVVTPASSGELQYTSVGRGMGSCSLTCHGQEHLRTAYPVQVEQGLKGRSRLRRGPRR